MKGWKEFLGAVEPAEREPIEVRNAVLEAIEGLVQPLGDGRRALMHNRIRIRLLSMDEKRRALLAAVLTAEPGLRELVAKRLKAGSCVVPRDLTIEISTDPPAAPAVGDFEVVPSIDGGVEPPPAARRPRPEAKLCVFAGSGPIQELEIGTDVVNVGRVKEVRGRDHRPVRRNHLYFAEEEASVSRQHAHIRYDAGTGEFRIFDDRSARGTRLFSNGKPIDVPAGRGRGEVLHSGDEIYFGTVGVRFEIVRELRGT
jgi:hypothetical protein